MIKNLLKPSIALMVGLLVLAYVLARYERWWAGAISGLLSLGVGIWRILKSEKSKQDQETLNLTQAEMLLRGGLGNTYVESIYREIRETGRSVDIRGNVEKALAVEPDNRFALAAIAAADSLGLSQRKFFGLPIDHEDVLAVKRICRQGRRLYPDEPMFLDSLGVVADTVGKHRIARFWFEQAGRVGSVSWRLEMATSFGMTQEFEQSLGQLELAKEEGAAIWWGFDFYMGRTLCSLGRYEEALGWLHKARRARRLRSEIVSHIRAANLCQLHLAKAIYYQYVMALLQLLARPYVGIVELIMSTFFAAAIAYRRVCRATYLGVTSVWPKASLKLYQILQPDMLEVDIGAALYSDSKYVGQEAICRKGLEAVPESVKLIANLSLALVMQGKWDEAIDELDKGLVLHPDEPVLIHNRSTILAQQVLNPPLIDAN